MHFTPHNVYHVYNRGNNKQPIFFNSRNYDFFLEKIKHQFAPICEILCWCLMPNHFHLMIYATEKTCSERSSFGGKPMQELPYRIGVLLSSYSQAINKQNGTTGSLFQQKTKAKCVTDREAFVRKAQSDPNGIDNDNYLITCMHYIHQNPIKAKIVNKIEDWKYSSFQEYIGSDSILKVNKTLLLSLSGYDALTFYEDSYQILGDNVIENIW